MPGMLAGFAIFLLGKMAGFTIKEQAQKEEQA